MIVLAVVVLVLATPLYFVVVVLDDDDSEDDDVVIDDGDVDALASAAAEVLDVCPWIIMMTIVEMPAVSSELLLYT